MSTKLVIVRGAGDLATGILYTLYHFGYAVAATELEYPSSIRRTVSFSEAVYEGRYTVENVTAVRCDNPLDMNSILEEGSIPVLIDPDGKYIWEIKPDIVVDAMLAKKNLGTAMDMAKIVIGAGPGFIAGQDVHAVVETKRGHNLGRVILSGQAAADTGIPGTIAGYSKERVIYSPKAGKIRNIKKIGDFIRAGEAIATVDGDGVASNINGTLRGLIRDGYIVTKDFKIADVDPRDVYGHCFTISDKARMVGFGTLYAIHMLENR